MAQTLPKRGRPALLSTNFAGGPGRTRAVAYCLAVAGIVLLLPTFVFLPTPRQNACRKQRRRPVDEGSHLGAEVAIGRIEYMDR